MIRNSKLLVGFLLIILFCFSCTSFEYFPSTVNAPIFKSKGEFEGSFLVGCDGFDLQMAYAPLNHFGIIGTGSYMNTESSSNSNYHEHTFGELGVGYFKKISRKFVFEVYGGYGRGTMEGEYGYDYNLLIVKGSYHDYDRANYNKYFIQPLVGMSVKVFEGGITARFSGIDIKLLEQGRRQFVVFFEPVIVSKVGGRRVKFVSQFGLSLPMGISEIDEGVPVLLNDNTLFDYYPIICSIGISVSLGGVEE